MLLLKVAIAYAIPDIPRWVAAEMAKIEYRRREVEKGNLFALTSSRQGAASRNGSVEGAAAAAAAAAAANTGLGSAFASANGSFEDVPANPAPAAASVSVDGASTTRYGGRATEEL